MSKIASINYPKRKIFKKDKDSIHYAFELDNEVLELKITGVHKGRFLYADDKELIIKENSHKVIFSLDGGNSFYKTFEVDEEFLIQQVYKLKNGNYLISTLNENSEHILFLVDDSLNILKKQQIGNTSWHSQNAIDEKNDVIMYGEYNVKKEAVEVIIWRSKDFGYTWKAVFIQNSPNDIRHWHTVQASKFEKGTWLITSGDSSKQCKWFISKNDGDDWNEITDKQYLLQNYKEKSQSIHRTTAIIEDKKNYYWATDDILGYPNEYFILKDGKRKTSSKFCITSRYEILNGICFNVFISEKTGLSFISEYKILSS